MKFSHFKSWKCNLISNYDLKFSPLFPLHGFLRFDLYPFFSGSNFTQNFLSRKKSLNRINHWKLLSSRLSLLLLFKCRQMSEKHTQNEVIKSERINVLSTWWGGNLWIISYVNIISVYFSEKINLVDITRRCWRRM
jgi:hypothetical protein